MCKVSSIIIHLSNYFGGIILDMPNLEQKLAEKITARQELEKELYDVEYRLDITQYEINNLKDEIISEYENTLEEKQQQIEDLQESQK